MKKVVLTLFTMAAMIACNNTEIIDVGGKLTNAITFDNVNTRAGLSDLKDNGFGVWACVSSKDAGSSVQYEPLLDNERVYLKDGEWTYDNTQLWISNSMFYFFAAYPQGIFQQHREVSDERTYTLYYADITADGSADTEDILLSTNVTDTTVEGYSETVPLTFSHLLTKVNVSISQNFKADPDFNYYVKKVTIEGIKGNGTVVLFPYEGAFAEICDTSNSNSIQLVKEYPKPRILRNIDAADPTVVLSVWGSGAMLIPQTIEAGEQDEQGNLLKGARIIVDYYYDVTVDDDYTDATLKQATAFIPAIQWKSSESINYKLSLANVTLITIDKPSIESWGAPQTGGTIIIK